MYHLKITIASWNFEKGQDKIAKRQMFTKFQPCGVDEIMENGGDNDVF
jgi:hypothetical protein